ncbi:MAG: glycoside hydrolase family 5 protein [Ginsengibacter sp.]
MKNIPLPGPVSIHGKLHVEGTLIKDEHGQKVVLRGLSISWHTWWPRFYNAGAIHTLSKDFGCSVIRAAMGIEPQNSYLKEPELAIKCVEAVVDAAIKEGIYVIIDWHSHHIHQKEAIDFFRKMANKYGHLSNIIYEVFNEPLNHTWQTVKNYSIKVIEAIREIDAGNIILIGSPHWDQDIHIAADDPIQGFKNIMYTLHYYAATHGQELRDHADYALSKGLPLFISESGGMESTGNGPLDKVEWQKWIDWSEQNNISWLTWSVSDKDETCSILKKDVSSTGPWSDKDLKESGILVRDYLLYFNEIEFSGK